RDEGIDDATGPAPLSATASCPRQRLQPQWTGKLPAEPMGMNIFAPGRRKAPHSWFLVAAAALFVTACGVHITARQACAAVI
ncbi:MAG: hypothetical protein OXC14_02200, partial [Rhodospirillaceae bacterium]|nr:hypothetical protein [Rhodospirillaceae bacterium]